MNKAMVVIATQQSVLIEWATDIININIIQILDTGWQQLRQAAQQQLGQQKGNSVVTCKEITKLLKLTKL